MLSCRAAASSSHASRAQPVRVAEVATTKPPSGMSGSVGQQQQAAALQQQIMQQLQMRRAAQYGARGGEALRLDQTRGCMTCGGALPNAEPTKGN